MRYICFSVTVPTEVAFEFFCIALTAILNPFSYAFFYMKLLLSEELIVGGFAVACPNSPLVGVHEDTRGLSLLIGAQVLHSPVAPAFVIHSF